MAASASTTVAPSRAEVLLLFRSLLRTASKFSDNNIRESAKSRTIDGFRRNIRLSDPAAVAAAFSDGKSQLDVARRQALIFSLYASKFKSVVEIKNS